MMARLSHLDRSGAARMVDVSAKEITHRMARAGVEIRMKPATLRLVRKGLAKKGDVVAVARIAGIHAAKLTSQLIPLCHPISTTKVDIDVEFAGPDRMEIRSRVEALDRTGVEMEAMTAAAVAALAVYDMCKAVDRGMEVGRLRLLEKTGGRSGRYVAPEMNGRKRRKR